MRSPRSATVAAMKTCSSRCMALQTDRRQHSDVSISRTNGTMMRCGDARGPTVCGLPSSIFPQPCWEAEACPSPAEAANSFWIAVILLSTPLDTRPGTWDGSGDRGQCPCGLWRGTNRIAAFLPARSLAAVLRSANSATIATVLASSAAWAAAAAVCDCGGGPDCDAAKSFARSTAARQAILHFEPCASAL